MQQHTGGSDKRLIFVQCCLLFVALGYGIWLFPSIVAMLPVQRGVSPHETLRYLQVKRQAPLVIAGSSVSATMPIGEYIQGAQEAHLYGGSVYLSTALAKRLIEEQQPRMVVVPLIHMGFDAAETIAPDDMQWIRHPHDLSMRQRLPRRAIAAFGGWKAYILSQIAPKEYVRDASAWQAYTDEMTARMLVAHRVSALASQRMTALQAIGQQAGCPVIYYVSPHNPEMWHNDALYNAHQSWLASLPDDTVNFDTLLPETLFIDWIHITSPGADIVSQALADTLRKQFPMRFAAVP